MQKIKRKTMVTLSLLLATMMAFGVFAAAPSTVDAAGDVTPMVAGGYDHSIALKSDGTVWAWGRNGYGQLGDGTSTQRNTPVQVSGLTGVTAVAAGWQYSLALKDDGTVWAWGNNFDGQLGNNSTMYARTPMQVPGLTGMTAVATGGIHSVALKSDGTVWAWGRNEYGQLGNGGTADSNTPVPVSNLTGVTAISANHDHSMALRSDGTVWAWGRNVEGQLGDGGTVDSNTPVHVSSLTDVTAIAAGYMHSLALRSNGTVWAWGSNASGQLGNGGTLSRYTPAQVPDLINVTAIAAGDAHSMALKSDGTVWAWGRNVFGQLGDSTSTQRNVPVRAFGLTDVTAIAAGDYHSMALKSDGTVWAWGSNEYGQLGNNSTTNSNIPVQVYMLNLSYPMLSAGSVDRTSDTSATIGFTASREGIAYYIVLGIGASTPSKGLVRSAGTSLGAVTAGPVTGLPVTLTAGAKDIYVVFENQTVNQISEPLKISAAAYNATLDTTPPTLSSGSVNRTSDTDATIGFSTDEAGTAYYLVVASNAAAPDKTAVVRTGTPLGAAAVGANSGMAVALTTGAKDIYVVVEDAAGNISAPLKISAAAYVYIAPPVLSAGTVNRTSDTAAAISFTSSHEGTAYYVVFGSGSNAISKTLIRSSGTYIGVVASGTTTGLPITLTAGARDIYVILENTTINQISEPLKISAAAYVDAAPPTLSAGTVNRTSDTAAAISFTSSHEGTAYYVVFGSGSNAISKTLIRSSGTYIGVVASGTTTGLPVTLTAGARDIYVVLENTTINQISEPLRIEAAAYVALDTTPPTLSSGSVNRTSNTAATIGFSTDEAGTAYYLVVAGNAAAPDKTAVVRTGTPLGAAAVGANSGMAVALTSGAKDIHVVVADAAGNISAPLKIAAAAYSASSGSSGSSGSGTGGQTDTSPPVLSYGSIDRTSNTAAVIGFITNEAGTAYYLVVSSNSSAPPKASVKAGMSLGPAVAGANNGKAVVLTAGAKDIYVVVEDAAGNVSEPLKIAAAAWTDNGDDHGGRDKESDNASDNTVIIIIAVAVLALAVVGVGAYWFFAKKKTI